jgi:hypothetical protein
MTNLLISPATKIFQSIAQILKIFKNVISQGMT